MIELTKKNIDENIQNIFTYRNLKFEYIYTSNNEGDTIFLGETFAKYINFKDVITLNGELGSGKTVFVKGIGNYFNIQNDISSPTFTIVNEYVTTKFPIYHFDVYRLSNVYEFIDTIGTDYFSNGICLIEWGKLIQEILPRNTINIDFEKVDDNKRIIKIWRK